MKLFNRREEKEETGQRFIPYHYPAIFDRTYNPTKNGEGVVCAILCFTVLESFINDLVGLYDFFSKKPVELNENDHVSNNYLNSEECHILIELKKNEKEDLLTKLKIIGDWGESEKCFQNLMELKKIRNNLIHLKPEKIITCYKTGEFSGYPKFLSNLFQKKIIRKPENAISWIELLESRDFCLWCQETTYQVLTKSIEMLPNTNIKKYFEEAFFCYDSETMRKKCEQIDEVT